MGTYSGYTGKKKEYYSNGKLKFDGEYKYGEKHGECKEYFDNGELEFEGNYVKGKKHGKGIEYYKYEKGKIYFEGEYLNGLKWNGKFFGFNTSAKSEIKNGNGKIKTYYCYYGKLELEFDGEYANGKKHGKCKEYYDNGKLKFDGEYANGKKHGKCKEYYSNGILEFEGEYLNEKRLGKCKEYYYLGNLKFEGEYKDGKKHGKCKKYYSNGNLKFEGQYLNGKKHGKCKEYYSNGKLEFEGEYENGKKSLKDYFITLQKELSKEYNNKEEKKISFEFEVRGTKEDLNGAALEISSLKKSKTNLEHIENDLRFISLNLEVKDESCIPKLQEVFKSFLGSVKSSFSDFPFELSFRNNGKLVSTDLVCNNRELVKVLIDLGNELHEYFGFNFILKTGINLAPDAEIDISKALAIIFSIKSETYNVKYFCKAIFKILKDVEIGRVKIFDQMIGFLDLINLSLGTKIKMEYDAKVLAEIGQENPYEKRGEGYLKIYKNLKEYLQILKGLLYYLEILDLSILEAIKITLGDPRYQNTYEISIKIPGLSKALENLS